MIAPTQPSQISELQIACKGMDAPSLLPRNGLAAFDVNGGRGKPIAPAKIRIWALGKETLPLDPRGPQQRTWW